MCVCNKSDTTALEQRREEGDLEGTREYITTKMCTSLIAESAVLVITISCYCLSLFLLSALFSLLFYFCNKLSCLLFFSSKPLMVV